MAQIFLGTSAASTACKKAFPSEVSAEPRLESKAFLQQIFRKIYLASTRPSASGDTPDWELACSRWLFHDHPPGKTSKDTFGISRLALNNSSALFGTFHSRPIHPDETRPLNRLEQSTPEGSSSSTY
ncbi:hypothetical protein PtB15_6B762 [Puccinia triticina]|nr:hypothetical protein PtB15_6B762 [Puccinia triticina]